MWSDAERYAAIRNGHWLASESFAGHASFHLNEMYSCFRKLGDIAQSFIEKKRSGDLQTFINVSLAESYEENGEGVRDDLLVDRCEDWGDLIPSEVVVLIAGVDVQDDRIEIEVVGFGGGSEHEEESWSIIYQTIYGDPSGQQIWSDLDTILFGEYETHDGRMLSIRATGIDTGGHHTQSVYKYVKLREGRRVYGIKGVGGEGRAFVGRPGKNNIGKVNLFPVSSDAGKELVYSRLKVAEPGPGYCHFPAGRPDEYFKQLTAEKLVTRYVRGHAKRVWIKTRPRNEALDVRVYALAALSISGINVNTMASKLNADKPKAQESDEKPVDIRQKMRQRKRGGFINSWRS